MWRALLVLGLGGGFPGCAGDEPGVDPPVPPYRCGPYTAPPAVAAPDNVICECAHYLSEASTAAVGNACEGDCCVWFPFYEHCVCYRGTCPEIKPYEQRVDGCTQKPTPDKG